MIFLEQYQMVLKGYHYVKELMLNKAGRNFSSFPSISLIRWFISTSGNGKSYTDDTKSYRQLYSIRVDTAE
jgi:hypothetical protein